MAKPSPQTLLKPEKRRATNLSHSALLKHLFELFSRIDRVDFGPSHIRNILRNFPPEIRMPDPRTINSAKNGGGMQEDIAEALATALSHKIGEILKLSGGGDMLKGLIARHFAWLSYRLDEQPPFIEKDDLIINRCNRHLIDDYYISLTVGPNNAATKMIHHSTGIKEAFRLNTLALVKYAMRFSTDNRCAERDFILRYSTDCGRLELISPPEHELLEPAVYRRHHTDVMTRPDPGCDTSQGLEFLVYGGYDPGKENAHFSFTLHFPQHDGCYAARSSRRSAAS